MAKCDRLRYLQVRMSWHDRARMFFSKIEEGGAQSFETSCNFVYASAQPQA